MNNKELQERLDALEAHFDGRLVALETSVTRIDTNTSTLVDIFATAKATVKMFTWLSSVGKMLLRVSMWIAGIVTIVTVLKNNWVNALKTLFQP